MATALAAGIGQFAAAQGDVRDRHRTQRRLYLRPRYNYGKTSWNIPHQYIKKRERLRVVAAQFGVDLRTAALQFSAAPDVAAALIVGAHTEAQVLANVSSMQTIIPPEFWAELKRQSLVDQNAPTPGAT